MFSSGGFGAHPDHDPHLLTTLSAIQILTIHDAQDKLNIPKVTKCMFHKFTLPYLVDGNHS